MKKFFNGLKQFGKSIIKGDTLLRMRFDKYLPHAAVAFFLILLSIILSMKAEQTTLTVEKNNDTIETLKSEILTKTYEIVGINKLSTIEEMLERSGSELKAPIKPAENLK